MVWKSWWLLLVLLGLGYRVLFPAAPERAALEQVVRGPAARSETGRAQPGSLDGRTPGRGSAIARRVGPGFAARGTLHGAMPTATSAAVDPSAFRLERFIVSPIEVDWTPEQVQVGDVTGDGRPDIVLAMNYSGFHASAGLIRVRVHAQNADGTLAAPVELDVDRAINSGSSLALVDLDHNGFPEIVVGDEEGLTVFTRRGGQFAPVSYTGGWARYLAIVNADGDAHPDVYAQSFEYGADVYYGDGKGGFRTQAHLSTASGAKLPDSADFTGDGVADLLIETTSGVWIHPVTAGFGLQPPFKLDYASFMYGSTNGMTIADVDRDGRPDLVVSDQGTDVVPQGIHVLYRGTGNTFARHRFIETPGHYEWPGANAVADLDGNGYPDIVLTYNSNDQMGYILQGPTGFAPIVTLRTDDNPWTNNHYFDDAIAVADVNSDKCPDVVIAEVSSSLRVFYGRNCRAPVRWTGGPGPADRQD